MHYDGAEAALTEPATPQGLPTGFDGPRLAGLLHSEAKLQALVNNSADIIAILYPDGEWEASDAGTRHLGYPKGFDPEGGIFSLVHPDDLEIAATGLGAILDGTLGPADPVELRLRSADGTYWDFECVGQNLGDHGAIGGVVITARNITRRKQTEAALREAQERFRAAFQHAPLGLAMLTLEGRLHDVNPAGCKLLGFGRDDLLGTQFDSHVHPDDRRVVIDTLAQVIAGEAGRQIEHRLLHHDGDLLWTLTDAALIRAVDGTPMHVVVMLANITERKESEELLSYSATHDVLTGLWNRSAFTDRLEHALARRTDPGSTALLFIDLDRFKMVNDTLGHQAGDAVLIEIANRLNWVTREADTVARIGGDEFVVLCEDLASPHDAIEVAERAAVAIESPIVIGNTTTGVGASIGIALSDGAQDAEALLRNSDAAVYRAKSNGRSRIEVFDAILSKEHANRRLLEIGLRQAIEQGTLDITYTPIVNVANRHIFGYQANCDWTGSDGAQVRHEQLIATATEMGLAAVLDRCLITAGCREVSRWSAAADGSLALLHIGLAPKHLDDPSLIKGIQTCLIGTGVAARRLCLEIPETWVVANPVRANETLRSLRDIGVHLALAEFGRSPSSFPLLREIDVDFIKMARTFYIETGQDIPGRAVVGAIVSLAHALGFRIIADGVDDIDDVDLLETLNCDLAQGTFFATTPNIEASPV